MKQYHKSMLRTALLAAAMSCGGVFPAWSQDTIIEPNIDSFSPVPGRFAPDIDSLDTLLPAFESDDDMPAPFSDTEVNENELDLQESSGQLTPQQSDMLNQSVAERQKVFRTATDNADEMLKTGRDSFERGLMPLEDYADLAQSALEVRLTIASLQNDRVSRISALISHSELLHSAYQKLKDLNQPASAGWAADMAFVGLLAANADLRIAAARGDRGSYETAVTRSKDLADQQYELRSEDFDQGLASLPSLARAASYLTTEVGLPAVNRANQEPTPSRFEEYLNKLDDVVEQTKTYAELESGIGREDRLHQAEFELAKAKGQLAIQQRDRRGAAAAFDQALDASQKWFESQVKFHETGTASLRDVTQAWWSRVELLDLTERTGLRPDKATQAATDAELAGLRRLVARQEDRRGRIAADVAYIKTLESLQDLWARQRATAIAAAQAATTQATTAKRPTVTTPSKRVVEFGVPAPKPAPTTIEGTTPTKSEKSPQSTIEIVKPQRRK